MGRLGMWNFARRVTAAVVSVLNVGTFFNPRFPANRSVWSVPAGESVLVRTDGVLVMI